MIEWFYVSFTPKSYQINPLEAIVPEALNGFFAAIHVGNVGAWRYFR